MCDCFHLAFPNWHAASSGTGAGRRLRGPEPGTEDDSICDGPSQFTEGERPRPQGSSPVEEYPETEKYTDSDKECEAEHDQHHKSGSVKKTKKSGLGSMFEKRSTPKMSKLKEAHSPESGVIVKTAKDGCAEGLIYGGGGKEGIFIKEVVPESPASKSLKLKEGDQILSATVYFDNVSYEDAIQILEHAQAYKVKLCLKRKPDITDTEPAMETDVIPEEELYSPEMREQGKTKRRGDARISWPKFPSFGKGRRSRFTRSHSSSEADEQRKLELSPTTSDTESPIKSQDALKGKKRHKMKLTVLTKRGRISSSEDQDTDAPTTGQISGDICQTTSDMLSPECLESVSGETPDIYVTRDLKVEEDLRLEQKQQKLAELQTIQHKAELISIDSTLKTADLTVALADQETPSSVKSPDDKKKKKERSELKMKILGKDKSHKKDAKAKASPKRLKTLGASIEIADQPENEKSEDIPGFESHTELQGHQLPLDASTKIISSEILRPKLMTTQMEKSIPKVELDISDVTFIRKSPQKGEEKTKKGKEIKQNQEAKTGTTFKLPKIGLSDIATEEPIQTLNANVEELPTKIEHLKSDSTEVKEDPYDRLSKSSHSKTLLPKREDIEIPGMEDMSVRTTAKGIKEPKVVLTGHREEIQAETLQLSIDVDSVKEAVSKLPGFKLPKVDTSGVPIPEEITVIDANAQRISVKTPTKVVDTKTKHEAHFTKFDITASPEISKTTVKLPQITLSDLTPQELLIETKVDLKKTEKDYKTKLQPSDKEMKTTVYKRDDIIIPGKESAQVAILQSHETHKTQGKEGIIFEYQSSATFSPNESDKKSKKTKITMPSFGIAKPDIRIPDIGIDLPKQSIPEQKGGTNKGEKIILLQEVKTSKTEIKNGKGQIGGIILDVKIPEIDNIEFIDSVGGSPAKKDGGIRLTDFGVSLDATQPKADICFPEIRGEVKGVGAKEDTMKLTKSGAWDININVPDGDKNVEIDGAKIETLEKEGEGNMFKMPNLVISRPSLKGPKIDLSLSKTEVDVTLTEAKSDLNVPEAPETDITLGDFSAPVQNMEVEKPELEIKPQTGGEIDVQGSKFKLPKFGIKMPKIKGPEFEVSSSKKDVDVTLPEAKTGVKLPDAPEVNVAPGQIAVCVPQQRTDVEKSGLEIRPLQTDGELDGQGSKFKMPKLGIKMPKIKGPEFDLSLSKKDADVTLAEAKAGVELPGAPDVEVALGKVDVSVEEQKVEVEATAHQIKHLQTDGELDGQGIKFKMPKLGIKMPKIKGPEFDLGLPKKDIDVTLPDAKTEFKLPDAPEVDATLGKVHVSMPEQKVEVEKPELEIKTLQTEPELDGHGGKFKMPKFGIKMPKIKGPEFDLSLSKKDADVTLAEAKAGVKLPGTPDVEVALGKVDVSVKEQKVEVEAPALEIKPLQTDGELDGQGSKFKMPKLGIKMPKIKGPEFDLGLPKKDISVKLPEAKAGVKLPDSPEVDATLGEVHISLSEQKVEVERPELEIKTLRTEAEIDGQGSKFRMPKFGIKMPKFKGPDVDLNLSKKDVDIQLPELKAGVPLPEAPEINDSLRKVDVSIPVQKMEVKNAELEIKPRQTESELAGQGLKLQMPQLGITLPNVKQPQIDLPLLEAKGEEPTAKMEINAPEINVAENIAEGSPSKFKMPVLKLPKFGVAPLNVSVEVSRKTKDIEIPETHQKLSEGVDTALDIPAPNTDIEGPSLDLKTTAAELDGKGIKFKMPKFGISLQKVRGPEVDLGVSKKDVNVSLPEAEADIKLRDVPNREPCIKVDVKAPETAAHQEDVEGSPSKFKMPTFKLPKFGVGIPNASVKLSEMDKDVKIDGADINFPEEGPAVNITTPSIDVGSPSLNMKNTGTEHEGKGSKFKMPHFGFSVPKVKGPQINLAKKDVDFTLQGANAEVKLPEAPEVDVSLVKAEISIPEENLEVKKPELETKPLKSEVEQSEGSKFKMPKLGMTMPKVKGSEIHFGLSKKDGDVTLSEVKEVQPNKDFATVEVKAPEINVTAKGTDGSPSKFKMPTFKLPKFGAATPKVSIEEPDVKLPEVDLGNIDISIPEIKMEVPEAKAEVKLPEAPKIAMEMKPPECEAEIDGHGGKFQMPKFGIKMQKVKGPEFDLILSKKDVDVTLPEAKADVKLPDAPTADVSLESGDVSIPEPKMEAEKPELQIKSLRPEVEIEGQGSKFKMPKFGISMPKVKGPEFHLGFSKKDVDVTLPEAQTDQTIPDVELKDPSTKVEIRAPEIEAAAKDTESSPSKLKMPNFSLSMPKVKGPDIDLSVSKKDTDITLPDTKSEIELPEASKVDVSLGKAELLIPETKVEVKKNEVQIKPIKTDIELEGQGGKFKMPKFGITLPKVKGPEIDLNFSMKDVDATLPEPNAEVKLPDVELRDPSAKVEVKAPEIEAQLSSVKESPSKFKLPSFKFPKFGVATPNVSAEVPDTDKEIIIDGAHMHMSAPHTDSNVPDVKADISLSEVDIKEPLGGAVIEHQSDVEIDAKLKKPRFSLPRFSFSKQSVKAPEGKDVNVAIPEGKVEKKGGEVDMKSPKGEAEIDVTGSKFKIPKFGITMPKVTGPEIDLSSSKKDIDVTLPDTKAEVKLPDIELKETNADVEIKPPEIKVVTKDTDGSPSKFKMPTFKLPKFGVGTPRVTSEVPDIDKGVKIDGADITIPEEVLAVSIAAPSIDTEGPSIDMKPKETDHEGKGSKFKLPSLGFSVTQVKGPDIDLNLSKKDVDVTLPEAKAEVKLPDIDVKEPSAEVEIKPPETKVVTKDTDGSPSKFKMPTFKLPKFGVGTLRATSEVPGIDKDVKIDGAEITIPGEALAVSIAAPSIDTESPSIDLKPKETDHEGKGSKFKMPSLGFSATKVKGPDIDLSLSKKDVDVKLPEAKTEVKLPDIELKEPSAEVEIKPPETKVVTKDTDGSPSKFKMPTFKLPKFGVGTPRVTSEVPDIDKGVKIDGADITIPEEVLAVSIAAPSIDTEGPSIDMKPKETDHEGIGSKFKMPSLGFSATKVKGPDIDLSLSKKDVDVKLPEAKTEVKLPDIELKEPSAEVEIKPPETKVVTKDTDGSPSKFKMPTFKLPKFGVGTPRVTSEVPDIDKGVKIDGADITIPEEVLAVSIAAPSIDTEGPSIDMKPKETDHEGKGSKFKLPSLGFSVTQVKGPDIDLNLSKKDVDVTLPEAKAEVKLPDIDVKEPSAEVEIKPPETKVVTKDTDGSPSKFKMPTFKLPKFGVGTLRATSEVPDIDKDVKIDGAEITIPGEALAVSIAAPSIDTESPSIDLKPKETDHEGKGSKFKMPSLGFSATKVKGPDIDLSLSKKDVDVKLPEAKTEVKLPDIELKEPSAEVEIKPPETKVVTKDTDGSPSKFKMPTFKLPRFGVGTPRVTSEVPDIDKDVKIDGGDITIPEEVLAVSIAASSIDTEGPSIDMKPKETDHEGKGSKFKLPSLGFSVTQVKGPDIDLSLSKKDVDVKLPEAKADVKLPDIELKEPSAEVEIKPPETKVVTKDTDGSPSKFKIPTIKLPKFGVGTPRATAEVPDMDKDDKIDAKDDVQLPDVELQEPSAKVEIKAPGIEVQPSNVEGSPSKIKMPTFKLSKFGVATPQVSVEVPDVDKGIKVSSKLPEAKPEIKLPNAEIREPVSLISVSQAPKAEDDTKVRKTSWTLPKFSFSKINIKGPEADGNLGTPKVDVTLPEAKTDVLLPDIDIEKSSSISTEGATATDLDAKLKKPRFSLPKFSFSKQSTKEHEVDAGLPEVDVSLPEGNVEVTPSEVKLKPPEGDVELDGQESKFKMPKFGISMPKVKKSDIDLSFSKKDVDVTLPEAKAEVEISEAPGISVDVKPLKCEAEIDGQGSKFKMPKFGPEIDMSLSKKDKEATLSEAKVDVLLPDVNIKKQSPSVEISAPKISNVEGSPSKLKMPTLTLPKFGAATPKVSVHVPDVDKDIKIDGAKVEVPKAGATLDVIAPSIDTEGLSVDKKAKGSEIEGSGSKYKMPHFGIAMPKIKGPEIDLSLSNKDVDITLPEAKTEDTLPSSEVKEPEDVVSVPDAPTVEVEAKLKRPSWTFPKFSFSKAGGKAPDVDVDLETSEADVTLLEPKAQVCLPDIEVEGPSGVILGEEQHDAEVDANLKKTKFSLPRFSFSKSSVTVPEVSAGLPHVDISLPEGEVTVKEPEVEIKVPEHGADHDEHGSKFKLPKFGISLPKAKGPEVELNSSLTDVDVPLPEVKAEVKLPEVEVKESSVSLETEPKTKDVGGSPLKFKMPTLKMPKFAGVSYGVTVEASDTDKAETDGATFQEDVSVNMKGPSVDIKTDMAKEVVLESETPKTEADGVGHGSPSKFKLPSFKMPKLSFSKPKPENEYVAGDNECKDEQLETEEETKSPKLTFPSIGEIFKNIDVEFDVTKTDKAEEHFETLKVETSESSGKQLEAKEKETNIKRDTTKSPERTGWFTFPKFGLSSPLEPAKISEKDDLKDEKSPVGETGDEEMSPTSSVQSSDAFADISSTMTSEHVGLSLSSPTKVTVKYSDPNTATGLEEIHSNIITSATRTELISVEPNLPEKITILSSGVSSSSEDTLRLESGKIHVITSNVQATPDAQHATILTAVQVQSAGSLPLKSEPGEAASWTVEDSQSGKRTVFERHLVRETSSERSESKETIVITKQITHIFDSSEPISGETASSIQRLRDSVHSEKMRFFDGDEK